jgi:hypothetical protein
MVAVQQQVRCGLSSRCTHGTHMVRQCTAMNKIMAGAVPKEKMFSDGTFPAIFLRVVD